MRRTIPESSDLSTTVPSFLFRVFRVFRGSSLGLYFANRHAGLASFGSGMPSKAARSNSMGMQPCFSTASWNCRSLFLPGPTISSCRAKNLPPADQIADLVQRLGLDEAPHLAAGTELLVPHAVDEERDHLLGRHAAEMIFQREDHAGRAGHPPEEHADAVLGRLRPAQVPQPQFPIQGPAFHVKGRGKRPLRTARRVVAVAGDARGSARAE